MENIQMAINFVSPGDYMISLDLKDAYFSVPISILFVETRDISLAIYQKCLNLLFHTRD